MIADSRSAPSAEARLALAAARQALSQPVSPRRLTEAVNVLGMVLKWPGDGVIVDRKVFLTGLDQAIRDREYAEPVVNEAMRRLRDNERWMPAISEVLAACQAVSEEWSQAIAAGESEARERERQEAREEYERECERDAGKRWRDKITELEDSAHELRLRRERLEQQAPLMDRLEVEEEIEQLEVDQKAVDWGLADARRRLARAVR